MITLSGGAFQDAAGNKLAGGRLVLQLSTDAQETVTNPDAQVVSQLPITIPLDANGDAPATQIWSNAELVPAGTYYTVRLYNSTGQLVWAKPQTWVFSQSTGQSLDIGTITPGSMSTPSYPNAVLLNPNKEQMIIGPWGLHGEFHGTFEGTHIGPVTDVDESNFNVLNATQINGGEVNSTGGAIAAESVDGGAISGDTLSIASAQDGNVAAFLQNSHASGFGVAIRNANDNNYALAIQNNSGDNNIQLYGSGKIRAKGPIADVTAFGADPTGATDSAAAINAAITFAEANGSVVYLPRGTYKVNSPIDMTERIGLTLIGDGEFQDSNTPTTILGNTGTVVLDMMGSSNCHVKNFRIRVESAYANPSKVGILQGRSSTSAITQYSQYNEFDNIYVYMDSLPAATARGRVALYNVAAEHTMYRNCYFLSDLPLAMAATDVLTVPSPILGAASHSGPASMTICRFEQCGFRSHTLYGTEFWTAENIKFESCYWSAQPGNTSTHAIVTNAGCNQLYFNGQLEQWPGVFQTNASISAVELNVFSVAPTQALVKFGSAATMSNCIFRIRQSGAAQSLFNVPAASVLRGCLIHTATTAGINDTDLTITGGLVITDDVTSDSLTSNAASRFTVMKNDGKLGLGAHTATTVGAAGGATALPATPLGYLVVNIGGTDRKIPYYNT